MDPQTHKRFLDYRERHGYFATPDQKMLSADEFTKLDAEHESLEQKGEQRDDEEEARWVELSKILFRD